MVTTSCRTGAPNLSVDATPVGRICQVGWGNGAPISGVCALSDELCSRIVAQLVPRLQLTAYLGIAMLAP
jgi:hypothetical protein